ncbi:MAG TPA: 6-carboxytetrahydropterin synthase QueD [Pyrinomonadaceae bacterium]|jgi:6-pyruvoyltetrahydropterin/6-carboxytetrahydropterin synthase|nr:6-carboxytetrahydropterin synthase QueD [Pyrinomonadaceae bacterium]
MSGKYEVMIEREFSSAHQLRGYKGKCENLHGHNYKVQIFACGEKLNEIGLLIDFGDLKKAADEVIRYLDHRNLNELPPFDEELNPSAENIARFFVEYLNSRLSDDRVRVYKVACFETPTSIATYEID